MKTTEEYLLEYAVVDGHGNLDGAFVPIEVAIIAAEQTALGQLELTLSCHRVKDPEQKTPNWYLEWCQNNKEMQSWWQNNCKKIGHRFIYKNDFHNFLFVLQEAESWPSRNCIWIPTIEELIKYGKRDIAAKLFFSLT